MNRWRWLALLLITGVALVLRLPDLDRRPLHNDEGVNALKLRDLWQEGRFVYDPNEFHGPSLYYASLPFVWLGGAKDFEHLTETHLRLVTVVCGVALVLLACLFADGLGWAAVLVAAGFTALSPAMVFYSRYFIHEMLLVVSSALLMGGGWHWLQSGKLPWAIASGAGMGLMYATKETFVFPLGAMIVASIAVLAWHRQSAKRSSQSVIESGLLASVPANWPGGLAAFVITAAALSVVLFTSFFTNRHGPLDSILTYLPWLNRAAGASPHIHPWSFYLERLAWFHQPKEPVWSEGGILLLAFVGAVVALLGRRLPPKGLWLARWLTVYTLALTAIYSSIAYKTPWCLLGFLHPMTLLAGLGAVALWQGLRSSPARLAWTLALSAAVVHLTWQAWQASFVCFASLGNPYAYSQTVPDILKLVRRVQDISGVHPAGHNMIVKVMAPDSGYGPLPYYLRSFRQVGWWDRVPEDPYAPVMIVSTRYGAALDEKSEKRYLMAGMFELRPGTFFELYVEFELWKKFIATLPQPAD